MCEYLSVWSFKARSYLCNSLRKTQKDREFSNLLQDPTAFYALRLNGPLEAWNRNSLWVHRLHNSSSWFVSFGESLKRRNIIQFQNRKHEPFRLRMPTFILGKRATRSPSFVETKVYFQTIVCPRGSKCQQCEGELIHCKLQKPWKVFGQFETGVSIVSIFYWFFFYLSFILLFVCLV